jgi:hypothetical protein
MAEISTIARPYAVAAYKLGREQKALGKWSETNNEKAPSLQLNDPHHPADNGTGWQNTDLICRI